MVIVYGAGLGSAVTALLFVAIKMNPVARMFKEHIDDSDREGDDPGCILPPNQEN